jgi:hypothetical protein
MWRHGIHSFLELLRKRLSSSLEHMLAFIYLAYSMMALLYETVPAFENTWIECIGDLGRYGMAIEEDDIRDREVWSGVARDWYSIASKMSLTTGRLYHHLAILARPNALQQLFYYAKSLSVQIPFTSARESILTLSEPFLEANSGQDSLPPLRYQRPDRNDGDTFSLPHKDDRSLPEEYISGPSWTGNAILAALRNKNLRSMVLLSQLLKSFPVTLASAISVVNSTSTEATSHVEGYGNGPSQYFRYLWLQLRDKHSGPIIENTTVAAVLSSSYFIITYLDDRPESSTPILPLSHSSAPKSWVQADLLPIATAFISASTLYLGNGKLESDWQLAMLATHNLCLSIRFIQQKLSKFPKTQKPVEFIMASTSLLSTGLLTKFFPVNEGRYKNPLVQAAMFLPLTNLFITVFWIRFIRNYGVATALEEGQGHLIAATHAFWQRRSYSIIAVVLILLLLAKV